MTTFKMVQLSAVKWQVESPKGHVLQTNITVSRLSDAQEFIRRYISSFSDCSYEIVTLKKDRK